MKRISKKATGFVMNLRLKELRFGMMHAVRFGVEFNHIE